jgi:hypothetical protein
MGSQERLELFSCAPELVQLRFMREQESDGRQQIRIGPMLVRKLQREKLADWL